MRQSKAMLGNQDLRDFVPVVAPLRQIIIRFLLGGGVDLLEHLAEPHELCVLLLHVYFDGLVPLEVLINIRREVLITRERSSSSHLTCLAGGGGRAMMT